MAGSHSSEGGVVVGEMSFADWVPFLRLLRGARDKFSVPCEFSRTALARR
jgi:hypothetical protein